MDENQQFDSTQAQIVENAETEEKDEEERGVPTKIALVFVPGQAESFLESLKTKADHSRLTEAEITELKKEYDSVVIPFVRKGFRISNFLHNILRICNYKRFGGRWNPQSVLKLRVSSSKVLSHFPESHPIWTWPIPEIFQKLSSTLLEMHEILSNIFRLAAEKAGKSLGTYNIDAWKIDLDSQQRDALLTNDRKMSELKKALGVPQSYSFLINFLLTPTWTVRRQITDSHKPKKFPINRRHPMAVRERETALTEFHVDLTPRGGGGGGNSNERLEEPVFEFFSSGGGDRASGGGSGKERSGISTDQSTNRGNSQSENEQISLPLVTTLADLFKIQVSGNQNENETEPVAKRQKLDNVGIQNFSENSVVPSLSPPPGLEIHVSQALPEKPEVENLVPSPLNHQGVLPSRSPQPPPLLPTTAIQTFKHSNSKNENESEKLRQPMLTVRGGGSEKRKQEVSHPKSKSKQSKSVDSDTQSTAILISFPLDERLATVFIEQCEIVGVLNQFVGSVFPKSGKRFVLADFLSSKMELGNFLKMLSAKGSPLSSRDCQIEFSPKLFSYWVRDHMCFHKSHHQSTNFSISHVDILHLDHLFSTCFPAIFRTVLDGRVFHGPISSVLRRWEQNERFPILNSKVGMWTKCSWKRTCLACSSSLQPPDVDVAPRCFCHVLFSLEEKLKSEKDGHFLLFSADDPLENGCRNSGCVLDLVS